MFVSTSRLWTAQPVSRELVSKLTEGLVWRGRKTQAIFDTDHISMVRLPPSGWMGRRTDGQTETKESKETHKRENSQALLPRLLLTQCRCKRRGMPEDESETISNGPM